MARRPGVWGMRLVLMLGMLSALAGPARVRGEDLAVDRLVVPPGRVRSVFPPGTELRSLPLGEFESLLAAARRGAEAERPAPRLLRADHVARWENGHLRGRSELVVDVPASGETSVVVLDPWSPAIRARGDARVASTAEGKTALLVPGGGRTTATVFWDLAARSETQGRYFALALPACTASTLTLDLPEDLEPAVDASRRSAPRSGLEPGRRRWVLAGATEASGLVLRSRLSPSSGPPAESGRFWVGGATAITVDDARAEWVATWEVERNTALTDTLAIELDPGLGVVAVEGPRVVGFAVEPAARPLLRVRLRPETVGSTPLTIRAQCRVPDEGAWAVPAARPLEAYWTGGRTAITLRGAFRRLETTRTLSGQPVPVRGDTPLADPMLVYDLPTPESPAELVFRRAEPEALAAIEGELRLGPDAPRMIVHVTWTPLGARLMSLAADLPGPWTIERVAVVGQAEEPAWQLEPRTGGATRLAVTPPAGLPFDAPITVRFEARGPTLPASEGVPLPRVTAVGARLADDVWTARAAEGFALRPREASGLIWIEADAAEPSPVGAALAWRWNTPSGTARLEVTPVASGPQGVVRQVVVVDSDRVRIEGQVSLDLRTSARRTLRVLEFGPLSEAPTWRWLDPAAGPVSAREVTGPDAGTIPGRGRRRLWELDLGRPRRGRVRLAWRVEQPLGERSIPVLGLLPEDMSRGTVLVAVERSLRSTVRADGLLAFSPDLASADLRVFDAGGEVVPRGARLAHAFSHGPEPGPRRLELQAERLAPAGPIGVIRDALLEETLGDHQTRQQRLALRIAMTAAGTLDVTLPDDATLQRVLVEGRVIVPTRDGRAISIPLPGPSASRPLANVLLEYSQPAAAEPLPSLERAIWPAFSLPCLDYCWQVRAGEERLLRDVPDAGVLAVIAHRPTLVESLFGSRATWEAFRRRIQPESSPQALAVASRGAPAASGRTLSDLTLRWEATGGIVLVDRLALQAAGLGPWSRLQGVTADGAGLGRLGLRVEPVGDVRLLTTTVTSWDPGTTGADRTRVAREAVAWGADRTGRYVTARHWRVAPAPVEAASLARPGSIRAGWVVGPGPVPPELAIRTASRWQAPGLRLAVLLGVLTLGVARRRGSLARRGLLLAAVAMGASLALVSQQDAVASGLALGLIATLSYWVGRGLRRVAPGARATTSTGGPGSTTIRTSALRSGSAVAVLLAPVVVWGQVVSPPGPLPSPAAPAADAPAADVAAPAAILVVQVDGELDRVLLSRADADRLETLAARGRASANATQAVARGVLHRLSTTGAEAGSPLSLRSSWEIEVTGKGPSSWTIPASTLVDLRATIDGVPAPLELEATTGLARVQFEAGAPRRLLLELEARTTTRPAGQASLEIPLRASAMAEVLWTGADLATIRFPNARGELDRGPETLRGGIGPVDRLVVEWSGDGSVPAGPRLTSAEGLLLWDALPSGDRIRARFVVRGLAGARALRVRLGPGIAVRASSLTGMEYASLAPEGDTGVWTALVDPSLGPEVSLTLDLWRPGEAPGPRTVPRVEVLGVDARTNTMGVRRPAGWTGRLEAGAGSEPVADEVFARSWGPFPEPVATLAGAIRFAETPAVTLQTAPVRSRAKVDPTVRVQVEPGRLLVIAEGTLRQIDGQTREVQVQVPPEWGVLQVTASGLTDWSRPTPEMLRLRFDRGERGDRLIRLEGWLPVVSDPLDARATSHRVPVPWPIWSGLEPATGTLVIVSPEGVPVTFEPSPEVRAQALKLPDLLPTVASSTPYRVAPAELSPGSLSWNDPPLRPRVTAVSAVTLYQNAAELASVLHYNVSGGPLESLAISLPTAWSDRVWLEAPGLAEPFSHETRGDLTVWTLTPSRPLWGTQSVRVRATRPYDRSQALEFPELLPRGRGEVRFALALLDASGQSPVIEGSGVEDVEASTVSLSGLDLLPGVDRRVFRIVRDRWRLAVQGLALSPTARGETPVALANVQITTTPAGGSVGVGRYNLGTQAGPFLAFSLPMELEILGAAVDGIPVRPLRDPAGVCLVPLGSAPPEFVRLSWSQKPANGDRGVLAFPQPVTQRGPTLLRVRGPADRQVQASLVSRLRPSTAADLDVIEVGESARLLAERVRSLDRSSAPERAELLASLIRFELECRAAEHAMAATESTTGPPRVRNAREVVTTALREASLEDFQRSAQVRLGAAGTDPLPELPLYPEPVAVLAAPAIGQVSAFSATGRVATLTDAVTWHDVAPDRISDGTLLILCAGLCVAAVLLAGSWLAEAVPRLGRLVLLALFAALLATLQPWAAVLVVGAGLLGRLHAG